MKECSKEERRGLTEKKGWVKGGGAGRVRGRRKGGEGRKEERRKQGVKDRWKEGNGGRKEGVSGSVTKKTGGDHMRI